MASKETRQVPPGKEPLEREKRFQPDLRLFGDAGGSAGASGSAGTSGGASRGNAAPAAGASATGASATGGNASAASTAGAGTGVQKAAASDKGGEPALRTKRGTPIYAPKSEQKVAGDSPNEKSDGETFQSLIKGKYKTEYDSSVQSIVQSRLKNAKAAEDKLGKLSPLLEALGSRYQLDTSDPAKLDIDKLTKSVISDQRYLEAEATEKGIPVDQMAHIKELEFREEQRKKAERRSLEERAKQQHFQRIALQSEETRQVYPGFNLKREMGNPAFQRLVMGNVPVRTAFEVIHKDEIISGAMQYTAQKVQQKIAKSIQAGAARPVENGITTQKANLTSEDIRSKTYRDDIKARALRGEKVVI